MPYHPSPKLASNLCLPWIRPKKQNDLLVPHVRNNINEVSKNLLISLECSNLLFLVIFRNNKTHQPVWPNSWDFKKFLSMREQV